MSDELGSFPQTQNGSVYTHPCPGTNASLDFGQFHRLCQANGTWMPVDLVDVSNCTAPAVCAACECYECGGPGQRVCGAAVGIQEVAQNEFMVNCAHKKLIVAPRGYPESTTRVDLQGNTLMYTIADDVFASAPRIRQVCTFGFR